MALFNITIEKVVVRDDGEIKKLLETIIKKIDAITDGENSEALRQEISDKLDKAIQDIKSTV
jgi:hypothetical protein